MSDPLTLLIVGDMHVTPEELEDCQCALDLVQRSADETKPDYVLFIGDQHHSHATTHVKVTDFWSRNVKRLKDAGHEVMMKVGNHDRSHDTGFKANTLRYDCIVIDKPMDIRGVRFIPWTHDHEEFLAQAAGAKVVVCHQTFDGSKYENGFYAKDGIDPSKLDAFIISGHIHTPQEFANVWYPGAPRWRILTDANTDRAIHYVAIHPDSEDPISNHIAFDTATVCSVLHHFEDVENRPIFDPSPYKAIDRVSVAIHGSAEYVAHRKPLWEAINARITTFVTKSTQSKVKESDGVPVAIQKYVGSFNPPFNTPKDTLVKMVQERIHV